jgi:hypothetical protein
MLEGELIYFRSTYHIRVWKLYGRVLKYPVEQVDLRNGGMAGMVATYIRAKYYTSTPCKAIDDGISLC